MLILFIRSSKIASFTKLLSNVLRQFTNFIFVRKIFLRDDAMSRDPQERARP